MKFSKITGCFYPDDIQYPNPPEDLVEVTSEEYVAAMSRINGETLEIENGSLIIIPAPLPTNDELLVKAKQAQIDLIVSACGSAIVAGFKSSALGKEYTYPSNETDQLNLSGNVTSSLFPNLTPDWATLQLCCDEEGNWAYLGHTVKQIQQVGVDFKSFKLKCLTHKANLQSQIESAATVNEILNISF